MSVADFVAAEENGCDASIFDEWVKDQEEISAVRNYVADYVQHRVDVKKGRSTEQPGQSADGDMRFAMMRTVGLIFEAKHREEMKDMAVALCEPGKLSFQRYVEVVESIERNEDESLEQLSYGRLVALTAFAGRVAARLDDMQLASEIPMIASYTSKYLQKRIALTWQQNQRSWDEFFTIVGMICRLNNTNDSSEDWEITKSQPSKEYCEPQSDDECCCNDLRWWTDTISALALCGILGIATFAVLNTVHRAR